MTSDNIQNLKGLRNSKNRDNVIAVLSQKNIPISVEDIFYEVRKMNSKIAISTVYRIIEKLYKLEIVQKLESIIEK